MMHMREVLGAQGFNETQHDNRLDLSGIHRDVEVATAVAACGGSCNFDRSFWILDAQQSKLASAWMRGPFVALREQTPTAFGRDWQGRLFCISPQEPSKIIIVDASTAGVYVAPGTLETFFTLDLTEYVDEVLERALYRAWRSVTGGQVTADTCVGPRVAEFLGGAKDTTSLELISLDVYWTVTGQYMAAASDADYDFNERPLTDSGLTISPSLFRRGK